MKTVAPLPVDHQKAGADMKAAVYTAAAVQMTAVVHMAAVVKTYRYSRQNWAVDIEQNQVQEFDYFTQV